MKIYHTQTAKNKQHKYHILSNIGERVYHSLCNSGSFWIGGYHNDKPAIKPNLIDFDSNYANELCPSCVLQAYKNGMIGIYESQGEQMNQFTNQELKMIIDQCDRIEEEYGSIRSNSERLLSFQIAQKANNLLGEGSVDLEHMKINLEDIIK
ncbi:hypothetical protein G9G63_09415 [Paenibacillus sp. EKM202P]|uniref:hypothetical protein n=1 Tax=unclassified Paenibacillus TaxID=185978 RepID=UPI0013ECAF74|nr:MULTISPECIES: hypothetical protein [unclassified Paenibacillus]KAF6565367.1 hypothetical protein G9G63_09415 [Paenibacillus sp. EKM202P]KAF6569308.1 hypothetical protein G9G64_12680 [Paenibacillus sp. EKM207P]